MLASIDWRMIKIGVSRTVPAVNKFFWAIERFLRGNAVDELGERAPVHERRMGLDDFVVSCTLSKRAEIDKFTSQVKDSRFARRLANRSLLLALPLRVA